MCNIVPENSEQKIPSKLLTKHFKLKLKIKNNYFSLSLFEQLMKEVWV